MNSASLKKGVVAHQQIKNGRTSQQETPPTYRPPPLENKGRSSTIYKKLDPEINSG